MVSHLNSKSVKQTVVSASPEKKNCIRFKTGDAKSSFSLGHKGSALTSVFTFGSQFNAVFIRTGHPTDTTKDGFTYPAEEKLKKIPKPQIILVSIMLVFLNHLWYLFVLHLYC